MPGVIGQERHPPEVHHHLESQDLAVLADGGGEILHGEEGCDTLYRHAPMQRRQRILDKGPPPAPRGMSTVP
ncbi:hypothetical protein GCM10027061_25410 [Nesterenkonia suensis]